MGTHKRIISSFLIREQTGHDVPRWMPFHACNSLLRSFSLALPVTRLSDPALCKNVEGALLSVNI